jgi:GNAT superfamily N-acetyltransferase
VNIHRIVDSVLHQAGRRAGLHVLRVFSRPLRSAARGTQPPGLELRPLGMEEVLAQGREPGLELREAMIRESYARGGRCVGALDAGALVGYVWFAYDTAPHVDGISVQVPAHVVYRFKAFVLPSHRGRGIAAALYDMADPHVGRPGRDTIVDCVAPQNRPSVAATLRSGSRPLGALAYWRAAGGFASFHSSAVRRLGLRFHRT